MASGLLLYAEMKKPVEYQFIVPERFLTRDIPESWVSGTEMAW